MSGYEAGEPGMDLMMKGFRGKCWGLRRGLESEDVGRAVSKEASVMYEQLSFRGPLVVVMVSTLP